MSSIKMPLTFGLVLSFSIFFLAGCGDKNSQSTFSADGGGTHVAGWLPGGHSAAAAANIVSCTECHGSDYAGGIAKVACTQCHLGDQQNIHPLAWGFSNYSIALSHGSYVAKNETSACANVYCHGANLTGVNFSGPSCTSCHIGGPLAVHPASYAIWTNMTSQGFHGRYVVKNSTASCANAVCHGTNLLGASGLSCTTCHKSSIYTPYEK
jgi:hypothetical protein